VSKKASTFTVKFVAAAKPHRNATGESVYTELRDAISPLRLAIQPSGHRSLIVRYRRPIDGKPAKLTLNETTLGAARHAAAAALLQLEQGIDPSPRRTSPAPVAPARDDSIDRWAADFLELHARRKNRASTVMVAASTFNRLILPDWRGRQVQDIRRRDVIELVERIALDRPYLANRTLAVLSKFFNWLAARDVIVASPVVGVERPHKEEPRARVLSDAELAALWRAAENDVFYGPALRLLVLTGARRNEVSKMRWSEIDQDAQVWRLPSERVKNGKPHAVPLAALAQRILAEVPIINNSDRVFPINGSWDKAKKRISARAGIDPKGWRLHDVRRTMASGLQRLGTRVEVIERALNHVSGVYRGVAGIYQRDPLADEVQGALQRWGGYIEELTSGKPAKVVKLHAKH
jgi:integrase